MRYVPKRPREGINVSKTHPLAEASTLLVGLGLLFTALAVALVFLIELSLYFVSPDDEARLFGNWLPDDLTTVSPRDERLIATQNLVDRLAGQWPDAPYEFRVEIDDSDSANAMAFPGGLIVVTAGLLEQMESENELAFVLGHELGHFRHRDHLRALGRGLVFSIFFTVLSGGDVNSVGLTVANLTLRSFGRRQELDADRYGLTLVQAQYGHVGSAWRLFERWQDDEKLPRVVSYLSTHPASAARVKQLEEISDGNGWAREGPSEPLPWLLPEPVPVTQGSSR